MATPIFSSSILFLFFLSSEFISLCFSQSPANCRSVNATDAVLIQFTLNLEYLEAELFLFGALGRGLDGVSPQLAEGGPPPTGARKANLDDRTERIMEELGYQEVGHLRAIISTVSGFGRPQIDLSPPNFAKLFD